MAPFWITLCPWWPLIFESSSALMAAILNHLCLWWPSCLKNLVTLMAALFKGFVSLLATIRKMTCLWRLSCWSQEAFGKTTIYIGMASGSKSAYSISWISKSSFHANDRLEYLHCNTEKKNVKFLRVHCFQSSGKIPGPVKQKMLTTRYDILPWSPFFLWKEAFWQFLTIDFSFCPLVLPSMLEKDFTVKRTKVVPISLTILWNKFLALISTF